MQTIKTIVFPRLVRSRRGSYTPPVVRPAASEPWGAADIKIEKGVPPPVRYSEQLAKMDVGDSFPIPHRKARRTVVIAMGRYSRKHKGVAFTTGKDDAGSLRCWRVS